MQKLDAKLDPVASARALIVGVALHPVVENFTLQLDRQIDECEIDGLIREYYIEASVAKSDLIWRVKNPNRVALLVAVTSLLNGELMVTVTPEGFFNSL